MHENGRGGTGYFSEIIHWINKLIRLCCFRNPQTLPMWNCSVRAKGWCVAWQGDADVLIYSWQQLLARCCSGWPGEHCFPCVLSSLSRQALGCVPRLPKAPWLQRWGGSSDEEQWWPPWDGAAFLVSCLQQLLVQSSAPGQGFPQDPSQLPSVSLPDICFS